MQKDFGQEETRFCCLLSAEEIDQLEEEDAIRLDHRFIGATRKSSGNDELKHRGANIEDAHSHTFTHTHTHPRANGAKVQNTQQFINV